MNTIDFQRNVEEKLNNITSFIQWVKAPNSSFRTANPITLYEGIARFIRHKWAFISAKHKHDILCNFQWLLKCCNVDVERRDLVFYNKEIKSIYINCLEDRQFMLGLYDKYFLSRKGEILSRSTFRKRKLFLNNLIDYAIRCNKLQYNIVKSDKFINRYNEEVTKEIDFSFNKVLKIVEYINNKNPIFGLFYMFLSSTGMRIEEALGIKYSDIRNNCIFIQRAISFSNKLCTGTSTSYEIRGLKHRIKGTVRVVPIVNRLHECLLNLSCYNKVQLDEFIFSPTIKYSEAWKDALNALGYNYKEFKPNMLRHWFITLLLEIMSPPDVALIVGNTKAVIYNHYAMPLLWDINDRRNKMEELFIVNN